MPDGRQIAQVKGISRKKLSPGCVLIAAGYAPYRSRVGYGISRRPIPPGTYTAIGGLFREHMLPGTLRLAKVPSGYRVSASVDLPLVPGGRYRLSPIEPEKATAMPYELLLVVPLELEMQARKRLGEALDRLAGEVSAKRIHALLLSLSGWAALPSGMTVAAVRDAVDSLRLVKPLFAAADSIEIDGPPGTRFLVAKAFLTNLSDRIERQTRRAVGDRVGRIATELQTPADLVEAVTGEMERRGQIVREQGIVLPAGAHAGLSPLEKGIIEELRSAAESRNLSRVGKGANRDTLRRLIRLRLIVRVGDRFCPAETYAVFAQRLLQGKSPGSVVALAEARELLGLSREQTVQFLESLDERGILRRDGHVHRMIKRLETE